ncbi:SRPBCC family protein [Pseudovibrio exalbescens]|uniref:SRPBCC family protein n=1 Tax=Pseudovibrio exalbescens TaxID=197461 RepID=UPI00236559BA|nr:SRPBCC family protein [Pseudovibrio exalbescens]MDD7908340.1 SRPBCC family protein [Pseudovibrio exalbescens]
MTLFSKELILALAISAGAVLSAQAQQMPTVEAERMATFGALAEFTSSDAVTHYMYDTGYVGGFVNAPLQTVQMLHFEAPVDDVWEWVVSGNDEWAMAIETLTWDHSGSALPGELGVGSERVCEFVGGQGTAYERVFAVEENRLFAYDLDAERSTVPLPIRDFFVIWTLEEQDAGGVLVTSRIYYHEAQDMGGNAAAAVVGALTNDFKNFANIYGGTYITM